MNFYGSIKIMAVSLSLTIALGSVGVYANEGNEDSLFNVEKTIQKESDTTEKKTEEKKTEVTSPSTASASTAKKKKKTETKKAETKKTTATTTVQTKSSEVKTQNEIKKEVKEITEITQKTVVALDKEKDKKKAQEKEETSSVKVIPKIYHDHSLEMKGKKEIINGFTYFNQADAAWNDNGYQIKRSGCGPTSMAVVITSLTGKWVTPIDTTVWAYKHGYYSGAGSAHSLIPALAKEYNLKCEGVGRDKDKIREALKDGNPVVCLMGPGYFTKGGHFMVLVGIDDQDHVTVADVGSRKRSRYQYNLKDIIAESKSASAGGPFWVISKGGKGNGENGETVFVPEREKVKLEYEVLSDTDMDSIKKIVQSGTPVMMMTDQKAIEKDEFVYITVIDKNQVATVTDQQFQNEKQYALTELLDHTSSDITGISFWKVSGNCDFLMPLSKKDTKKAKEVKNDIESTSMKTQ
ncbi:MAG: C39 family peptidase [Lachnospiraceae bacterium]|nr:C39 family peptidase [Lachnospiraceae bacterium]